MLYIARAVFLAMHPFEDLSISSVLTVLLNLLDEDNTFFFCLCSCKDIFGALAVDSVNAPMVRTLTVRPDHLCCHKWSGLTTCECITGPPGPIMLEHKWSRLNINGPVLHVLLWV